MSDHRVPLFPRCLPCFLNLCSKSPPLVSYQKGPYLNLVFLKTLQKATTVGDVIATGLADQETQAR